MLASIKMLFVATMKKTNEMIRTVKKLSRPIAKIAIALSILVDLHSPQLAARYHSNPPLNTKQTRPFAQISLTDNLYNLSSRT